MKALQLTGPSPDVPRRHPRPSRRPGRRAVRTVRHLCPAAPALGRTRDAAADADPARLIPRLIALGLLARVDEQTVELPPMVGQLLRGEAPIRRRSAPPTPQAPSPASPRRRGGGRRGEAIRN